MVVEVPDGAGEDRPLADEGGHIVGRGGGVDPELAGQGAEGVQGEQNVEGVQGEEGMQVVQGGTWRGRERDATSLAPNPPPNPGPEATAMIRKVMVVNEILTLSWPCF